LSSLLPGSQNSQNVPDTRRRGKYYTLPLDQCAICAENASFNLNLVDAITPLTVPSEPPSITARSRDEPPPYSITTPYVTSCGHIYCYHCIAEHLVRAADDRTTGKDGQWECLRCTESVRSCSRLEADMLPDESTESEYEFSDLDVDEVSTNVSSYSEGLSD
jgi:peroxin-2